jgi:hypothetical protein
MTFFPLTLLHPIIHQKMGGKTNSIFAKRT